MSILFHSSMKFLQQTECPHMGRRVFAASHLRLFCLPMPIKRTPVFYRLIIDSFMIPKECPQSMIRFKVVNDLLFFAPDSIN